MTTLAHSFLIGSSFLQATSKLIISRMGSKFSRIRPGAYELPDLGRLEKSLHFGVKAKENQDKVPTLYWLPKLHKKPYKARFIANSSSCTTTELSKLLTSCLTTVKKHVIKYCEKVYERSGKNLFWSIKNSGEILDKLKARDFNATSLSTYDFSTLYTTLPHNLIKDKLIDLIERTFQREGSPYLACNDRMLFLLQKNLKNIMHGRVKIYVMH